MSLHAPHTESRAAVAAAVFLAVGWAVVAAGAFLVARSMWRDWTDVELSLVAEVVLTVAVLLIVVAAFAWREVGINPPSDWRSLRLLVLPALLVLIPFAGGFEAPVETALWILVAGYALTGVAEELFFRGIMLKVLGNMRPMTAVSVAAILFGLVHLGNILIRGEPAVIAAQAVGAACFGFGYGALRLRTGTIWPLIILHALTDLFLQLGGLPLIPVAVGQDIVLLVYGFVILRPYRDRTATGTRRAAPA